MASVQKCASDIPPFTGECAGGSGLALTHDMLEQGYEAYKDIVCIPAYQFCQSPNNDKCDVERYAGKDVKIEGKLESLLYIERAAFNWFTGKVTWTAECPNLKEVGEDAFSDEKDAGSKVILSNAALLESIDQYAFKDFSGIIEVVGSFSRLKDIGLRAFFSAFNSGSRIEIKCRSDGGLTVDQSFDDFGGTHIPGGEQIACSDTTTTTTITTTTTTTTITVTTTTTFTATTITTTTTSITTTTTNTTTTATVTTTTTTTTALPVNAQCDPHNDQCDSTKNLFCQPTPPYQCVYRTTTATATTLTTTATTKPKPIGLPMFVYGTIGGGALLIVLGIIFAYCCFRQQKLKRLRSRYVDDYDDVQLLDLEGSSSSSSNNNDYFDPQLTLQRKAISFGDVIGEGNFGKVRAGVAKDPQRGGAKIAVAIKSPSANARVEFEAEMEIMGQLTRLGGHPHIVGVVGCVYGNRPLLVLEFCAGGNLKAALTAARTPPNPGPHEGAPRFQVSDLANFGYQVALALSFLEHHGLLHRDLATRNVLLTDEQQLECKLADFGLSRAVAAGSDYYRRTTGKSAPIPVRWMAPETLEDGVSTINSEKWSFGVLLWEIFSFGLRPYIGVQNHEIAKHIREGHRLEQPQLCPDEIYSGVMQQCWEMDPAARPAFDAISEQLHGLSAATHV